MYKFTILLLLLVTTIIINAQEIKVPVDVKSFVTAGLEPLDYKTGDLNGDKLQDAILILKNPGEDTLMNEDLPRPLIILIRQPDNKLKQMVRTDIAVMRRNSGGVFGDPYEGMQLFEKGFSLSFYGGSSWRWAYNYEFRWNNSKKNWFLTKESQSSFQAGDPETTMKHTEIEVKELGEILFEKFNSDSGYEDSKWKVKASKTFFYDNPKLGTKPRKGYLMKGNIASGIRQLKNFVEVSYESGKGIFTEGFILKKDLEKVN
jgi:hypothetical protein